MSADAKQPTPVPNLYVRRTRTLVGQFEQAAGVVEVVVSHDEGERPALEVVLIRGNVERAPFSISIGKRNVPAFLAAIALAAIEVCPPAPAVVRPLAGRGVPRGRTSP